jgi:hypothetical protein
MLKKIARLIASDILGYALGLLSFAVVVFLAWHLDIYYDEAYSYLNGGRWQSVHEVFLFRIANTHVLNSLLMTLSTALFPYRDFAIRLPAVLMALVYTWLAIQMSRAFRMRFLILALFLFFDYLLLFHSLGRGYGMSATLILASIWVYHNRSTIKNPNLWLCWLPLLAFYANFVVLPFLVCFWLYWWLFDLKGKFPDLKKGTWVALVFLLALGILGFLRISRSGKPLYGAYQASFWEAVPQNLFLHFTQWYTPASSTIVILSALFIVGVLLQYFLCKRSNTIGFIGLITFGLIALLAYIFNKPLPTGRALLPYWPLIIVSLGFLLNSLFKKGRQTALTAILDIGLAIVVLINTVAQIPFGHIYQQKQDQWRIFATAKANDVWKKKVNLYYYVEQEKMWHEAYSQLHDMAGDSTKAKDVISTVYPSENLALLTFNNVDPTDSLCKAYFKNGLVTQVNCLAVENHAYIKNENWLFYQSLVMNGSDSVQLYLQSKPNDRVGIDFQEANALRPLNRILWEAREGERTGTNLPAK